MWKIKLIAAICLFASLANAQNILDIGLFKVPADSSVLEIRIKPSETVNQGAYTAGVFTLRHLTAYGATITAPSALNNPLYRYSLVNQGTSGAYKYYSFSFVSPFTVNWTANVEYPIARVKLSADCHQPNAVFELINDAWTLSNNGNVYQELNGLESQDSIYQSSVTTVLAGTILDTIPPAVTCTSSKQVVCDTNQCNYTHSGIAWNAIGSDNCSGVTLTYFLSGATLDTLGTLDQAIFQAGITDIMVVGADGAGLTDTCMFQVTVADVQAPTLTAPADITVSANVATCSASGVQLSNAMASDNCPGVQVTHNAPDIFPSGSTVVVWTATDGAGLTATATQTVTVQSTLSVIGIQASLDTICARDSVSVIFQVQGGVGPYTILYKLNNINVTLTGYEPNTPVWYQQMVPTIYKIEHVTDAIGCQVSPVLMQDTVQILPPPTLYGVTATPTQICPGDPVLITAMDLRPEKLMTFGYTIEPGGGPMSITGMSAADGTFSFQAPNQLPGMYTLTISMVELNGCTEYYAGYNSASFTVLPNPGIGGIAVVDSTICSGLAAEVVAFGLPPDVQATFTYLINGASGSSTVQTTSTGTAVFVSAVFPEGAYTLQLNQIEVGGCSIDTSFSTHFTVNPFNSGCGLAIGGRVATEQGVGVEETRVTLSGIGSHGPLGEIDFTDSTGAYRYQQLVPPAAAYTLTPFKNDNPLNGVTTFDLVLISKHILGLERLSSPYRMIAADANKSGSITTFDIVELRKLILGLYSVLPNNTSWRFVDKAYVFPDTLNPFTAQFPETIMEDSLVADALMEDFVGIKVGDVNGTVVPSLSAAAPDRDAGGRAPVAVRMEAPGRVLRPGEQLVVQCSVEEALDGMQFTLEWRGLALQGVSAAEDLYLAAFDDAITGSWMAESAEAPPMFALTFRVLEAGLPGDMLSFSHRITTTEAYRRGGVGVPVEMALLWQTPGEDGWDLRCSPNPFTGPTRLTYTLPEAGEVSLTIVDELGRLVYRQTGLREAGAHVQVLDAAAFPEPGMYVCSLKTPAGRRQLKLVKIR